MPLLIVVGGVLLLLVLLTVFRLNTFVAMLLASLAVGMAEGMGLADILKSVQAGIGGTMGALALVLGLGVMLGRLLADSGAAWQIAHTLIGLFGIGQIKWALVITGFTVGVAMFYNAGFVVLIPIVFTVASQTGLSPLYVGIPVASALSVTHGYLPPHPGPSAIAVMFKADLGLTLLYGVLVSIPAIVVAGVWFPNFLKNKPASPPAHLFESAKPLPSPLPSFGLSLCIALVPVALMALATLAQLLLPQGHFWLPLLSFMGDPGVSLLLAVLLATYFLGVRQGRSAGEVGESLNASVGGVAMMLLIIGGGGAFKQVITDSGVGQYTATWFQALQMPPLVLGWLVAASIRVAIGSATVAGLTAAGIVQPLLAPTGASPELMVLAIGAGSLMFSHVNDTGFWMFKEYFGLSIGQTIGSWSLMETLVSVMGLLGVLLLNVLLF